MIRFETFIADTREELDRQLNKHFEDKRCAQLQFVDLARSGETTYAVLVAWEEAESE